MSVCVPHGVIFLSYRLDESACRKVTAPKFATRIATFGDRAATFVIEFANVAIKIMHFATYIACFAT